MGTRKYNAVKGTKYGQWTVLSNENKNNGDKSRTTYFNVVCKCGKEGWRAAHLLVSNSTRSCQSCCKKGPETQDTFIRSYFNRVVRRAKVISVDCNIDPTYLETLFIEQEKKCALSKQPIYFRPNWERVKQTASLDRIDNTQGYVKGNVQWVHKNINMMKGTLTMKEFTNLCKMVSKYG